MESAVLASSRRTPPKHAVDERIMAIERPGDSLFCTPEDLRCPITHEPFLQPVLTAGGHVYERAAIEKHLTLRVTDPLTGAPLPNRTLTPVYILQSRALEYRQRTAQACVDLASAGALDPGHAAGGRLERPRADYLRRAVELVAGSGLAVAGLNPETIDYAAAHSEPWHDAMTLITFARGLFHAGMRDRAAHVYWHLLCEALGAGEPDVAQAAALLAQCIACWAAEAGAAALSEASSTPPSKHAPSSAKAGPGEGAVVRSAAPPAGMEEGAVMDRLAVLVTSDGRSPSVDWSQLIELVGVAGLGDGFSLRLCERVLFSRGPTEAPVSDPQQWSQEKALLFKYTSILSGSIARQQASLGRRLSKLEQRQLESEMATGGDGREDGGAAGAALSPLHAQLRLLQEPWVRAAAVVGAICLPCQEPWVTRTLRVVCVALVARTSA